MEFFDLFPVFLSGLHSSFLNWFFLLFHRFFLYTFSPEPVILFLDVPFSSQVRRVGDTIEPGATKGPTVRERYRCPYCAHYDRLSKWDDSELKE